VTGGPERSKNRGAFPVEFGQPGVATLGSGRLLHRRMIPPERFSAGRRVGHDEHRRGDLQVAQHGPGVLEDAEIRIIERDGGEVT